MALSIINPDIDFEWLRNNTGKGVEMAVIDSGVDPFHPMLKGMVSRAVNIYKKDGIIVEDEIPVEECRDGFGHGTAVAGVIKSIAPDVKIVNVKILNEFNACSGDVLIRGIEWALEQNIKLINMSLATSKKIYVPKIMQLCERAYRQNSIIVASRRNLGDLGCPAMFSSVISVEIGEAFEETFDLKYKTGSLIECDARGIDIKVPTPHNEGYALQTGTSFATPHVCSFVALMLESYPDLLAAEAKSILKHIQDKHA